MDTSGMEIRFWNKEANKLRADQTVSTADRDRRMQVIDRERLAVRKSHRILFDKFEAGIVGDQHQLSEKLRERQRALRAADRANTRPPPRPVF